MIQSLEIYSSALKQDDVYPLRQFKKPCISFHRFDNLKSSVLTTSDISTYSDTIDWSEYCNENDTFVSALCNSPETNISEVDTSVSCDKSFEIGTVIRPIEIQPRITTRRQRRANDTSPCNYSDFCNNDLAHQIEVMVLEVETAYANRHTKKLNHGVATEEQASAVKTLGIIMGHTRPS